MLGLPEDIPQLFNATCPLGGRPVSPHARHDSEIAHKTHLHRFGCSGCDRYFPTDDGLMTPAYLETETCITTRVELGNGNVHEAYGRYLHAQDKARTPSTDQCS